MTRPRDPKIAMRWPLRAPSLEPSRRRNADQRNRGIRGESVELAAGHGHRLVDRVDSRQIDQLAADDHKDIRRDGAVAVVDRGVLPQPPQAVERGLRRDRTNHAVAALHPDNAVEIDRAHRTAALLEDTP